MICELKTFEEMTPAEQRRHLLDVLTNDGADNVDLEELRKVFLKRIRQPKSGQRAYLTCKELGELVGRSADTIRQMFINEKGVLKTVHSGRNRKTYITMLIPKALAKRKFSELNI